MENSHVAELLDDALTLFERPRGTVEAGLNVDEAALLQLRKACRLIEAATFLRDYDGYYTVIVETSFAALERTIQFYLLDRELLHEDEYVNHADVYRRGRRAGLYDREFAGKLEMLWRNNRSETYYREGIATEERSERLLALAEQLHDHVLQLAGREHECICIEV